MSRLWDRVNRWSDVHTLVFVWAMYFGCMVVLRSQAPGTASSWGPTIFLVAVATGWFATWPVAASVWAAASVFWGLMGFDFVEIEVPGARVASAVALYIFGLLFLGLGRLLRNLNDRGREVRVRSADVQRLQEQRAFQTRFLNMAAHEIGTPLTPLKLQLATLLARAPDDERVGLERMQRNVARLERLTQDLLMAGRINDGRLPLAPASMDLTRVATDVVEANQDVAAESGLYLKLDARGEVPVHADLDRLGQVAWNLVRNAVRLTPEGGTVTVACWADDAGAHLEVKDTGMGLTSEQVSGLFQPFAQFHRDRVQGGTGLGLYVCKGIVDGHGGTLVVESAGRDQGAAFRVTLPKA